MHGRLLLVGAAVLILQPARSIGQSFVGRSDAVPLLAAGQKVRVWALEQTTFLGMPTPRLRELRIVGTLTDYHPPDSLTLRRTALFVAPWRSREHTARWESIHRIDVPHGRDVPGGALAGLGIAIGYGLGIAFVERGQRLMHQILAHGLFPPDIRSSLGRSPNVRHGSIADHHGKIPIRLQVPLADASLPPPPPLC